MTVSQALARVTEVRIDPEAGAAIAQTAARIASEVGVEVVTASADTARAEPGVFRVSLRVAANDERTPSVTIQLDADGSGGLAATSASVLYGAAVNLVTRLGDDPVETYRHGQRRPVAFAWQRSLFDFVLTQEGRIQHGRDPAAYIERLAARGFTHVEVNGLAAPSGLETGPPGEIYPMFYTYGPALDQFVSSRLNAGLYPEDWLAANLANLKANAAHAVRHGLVPGLFCFEPRSVPEEFFRQHPMLRGARVDHPFRSFKPRYNMTITHPVVLEHYAEMVDRLLAEVPELGFLSIWTNDSGAGFEYTKSLYVGRNGGAYLIREWNEDAAIARTAGENALRFLRALRDAGRSRNPTFRVLTRMESFYGEHDTIWAGLEDGVEVESASLVGRGWEMPYTHRRYPDSHAVNAGTVYQDRFDDREGELLADLGARGVRADFYVAAGPHAIFAPLLGVPYPRLTGRRLQLLHANGVRHIAHVGGTPPPGIVPFDPNHEMVATLQFAPEADIDRAAERLAVGWAGPGLAPALLDAWEATEEAILAYPNVVPLYSMYGFVWYRLWTRPFVPNIEAIPEAERAYYQAYMCTTPHNPNNVDLSRDVLFQLTTPASCRRDLQRFDAHVWAPIDRAVARLEAERGPARQALGAMNVIEDQWVRIRALRCWLRTQRSVAAWVVGVHGFLAARAAHDRDGMRASRALLREMMLREIANSEDLLDLVGSGVEFMATTDLEETPLIHGRNFDVLLPRRIALMRAHLDDDPWIDTHYIERRAAEVTDGF
ncbi:MAG: hypothetical protein QGF21_11985 [Vicinamibacterales bacterium]|jgi:hypothetical protein|nr:hypothetical protein [Acidobacteriota bacterium]MDP7471295.1 hypothetical protein [Vicinamibacterales bacterium]MDP7672653.1 hypothetical protein [Vicinamibacterales bacterium]HJO37288.1 hypothetical protein [Vicinamibacterales bacterium]